VRGENEVTAEILKAFKEEVKRCQAERMSEKENSRVLKIEELTHYLQGKPRTVLWVPH
jgi:3,4-dihydroxy-2-butanone 4-phosphate synthase